MLILRPGKWDIPAFLGDGSAVGLRLAYLTVHVPFGVLFSLNQAYPFVRDAVVLMGFPDILFAPEDAYQRLLERAEETGADVVLGLFPTDQPEKAGVVEFDESGRVMGIYEKSSLTHLRYMGAIALTILPFYSKGGGIEMGTVAFDAKRLDRLQANQPKYIADTLLVRRIQYPSDAVIVELFGQHPRSQQMLGRFPSKKLTNQVQRR